VYDFQRRELIWQETEHRGIKSAGALENITKNLPPGKISRGPAKKEGGQFCEPPPQYRRCGRGWGL